MIEVNDDQYEDAKGLLTDYLENTADKTSEPAILCDKIRMFICRASRGEKKICEN
jgi:hypothetical protein